MTILLKFEAGTVTVHGVLPERSDLLTASFRWDDRTACFRAPAAAYAELVLRLTRDKTPYADQARGYGELASGLSVRREPRPFQTEALAAWRAAIGRGLVVLPTGAGKSYVAELCIDAVKRDTLVIAPTLDLVAQWYDLLGTSFRTEVGVVGGGEHIIKPITVATYDSAYIHIEHLGARFGLLVFDECHHLAGESYALIAECALSPYRLGLSATPERADGRHERFAELIGPVVYRKEIGELSGEHLAGYSVERIMVELTDEERAAYEEARQVYRDFLRQQRINMGRPDGWSQFILRSSLSPQGRRAMQAYQRQRGLAFAAPSKLTYVEHLLHRHREDRVLLFTERNESAYEMSRRFLVPVITHQTKVTERSALLADFAAGNYRALATSKVLNEGVDIPDANVGIIISGSGSVREHVQRLGRILRKKGGKTAVLYELVASDTAEMYVSTRRREHSAYR